MIEVTSEPARKLVRALMRGMLTLEEVERFSRDEEAAIRRMGLKSGEFVLLVEALGNQVQSQEVMNAFQALMLGGPFRARKIAIARSGVLTRMQARRMSKVRSGTVVFDNVADAEAWLMEIDGA